MLALTHYLNNPLKEREYYNLTLKRVRHLRADLFNTKLEVSTHLLLK